MIAIYAGSFDPPTAGHLSVARQAARIYAHLVIVVAVNPEKQSLFDADERVALLEQEVRELPNVTVARTDGLIVNYARRIGASVLVRGIRGASDVVSEMQLAHVNRLVAPEIATVFLPADAELAIVSSSALKCRRAPRNAVFGAARPRRVVGRPAAA
jgi:pantetheine-phosphate adenylyltransferase